MTPTRSGPASLLFVLSTSLAASDPAAFQLQRQAAENARTHRHYPGPAKNIILFLGDGMGITTVTAARILQGQLQGKLGEEHILSFEEFEHTAFSKTYNVNQQTPDSAGTMSAIMTGHKTNAYVINYDSHIELGNHQTAAEFGGPSKKLPILTERFERLGKSTGIVTTNTLVHATQAACYAHSPNRYWVDDNHKVFEDNSSGDKRYHAALLAGVKDIASQLIEFPFGDGIDVALGGGWRSFHPLPDSKVAEPISTSESGRAGDASNDSTPPLFEGRRLDGRNLPAEWVNHPGRSFVSNRTELEQVDPKQTKQLLGIFAQEHLAYTVDRIAAGEKNTEPPLPEMALKALQILRNNPKGFFLMVESGRIDHGHHGANAHRALHETVLLADTVEVILDELSPKERAETLVIVTADHSHTFTLAGYPTRGNPIFGKVVKNDDTGNPKAKPAEDLLGLPFTTLSYANGGGYPGPMIHKEELTFSHGYQRFNVSDDGPKSKSDDWKYVNIAHIHRPDLSLVDTTHPDYIQEAAIPLESETHGAEDVPIYATGPGAFLFRGTREQNYIYHAMDLALRLPGEAED